LDGALPLIQTGAPGGLRIFRQAQQLAYMLTVTDHPELVIFGHELLDRVATHLKIIRV
jgi:hypothetical protein